MSQASEVKPELLEQLFGELLGTNKAQHAKTWATLVSRRTADAGTKVCARGTEAASLFLVESGDLEVSVTSGDEHQVLASLRRGDWFGELGLISPGVGTADVMATTRCTLFELDQAGWNALKAQDPAAARALLHHVNDVLSRRILAARGQRTEPAKAESGWLINLVPSFFGSKGASA